jgi:NhaP-type Na+/H+ and K+/H+ antiporter
LESRGVSLGTYLQNICWLTSFLVGGIVGDEFS